tara:strand:- start:165 stop:338 length:174 start_codon:yes stop_codon:yes gene_type:complete
MSHQNSKGAVASVYPYGIVNHHNKPEEHPDTMPSDHQPPGVDDDDDFPQSLEEALTG